MPLNVSTKIPMNGQKRHQKSHDTEQILASLPIDTRRRHRAKEEMCHVAVIIYDAFASVPTGVDVMGAL